VICTFSGSSGLLEDFSFVTVAHRFLDIIKNWQAEEIEFSMSDLKVVLKSKNKRVTISCLEDEGYWNSRPLLQSHSFSFDCGEFKKIIQAVAFCSSKGAYDVTHRCLLIESTGQPELLFASHEGFRLASAIIANSTVSGSFRNLVDADMAMSVIKMFDCAEQVYVTVNESRVDFFDSKTWIGLSTIPAKYPDVMRVRAMTYPCAYTVDSNDLKLISKSILSVIRHTDKPRSARLSISNDAIVISALSDDTDIEDSMPVCKIAGDEFEEIKGCDIVYLSEPAEFFSNLVLHTGPDKKHGYIFTSSELPGWVYHLLATK
jgi:DNA polymerase III sliding clamp (beta) subunit (PCNA family)